MFKPQTELQVIVIMARILIGIDDTDNDTSPGTGRLARRLSSELQERGMRPLGVTRHQFLVDPAIPYTSHNSGACIAVVSAHGLEPTTFAFDFVARHSAKGSDPGVCIAWASGVSPSVVRFAHDATENVLEMEDAYRVAKSASIELRGLGGSCQGVIGALACVGLRAEGSEGRFIDLPGLRELPRYVDAETYENIGIKVQYRSSREPDPKDRYDTLGWVRPRLVDGEPVLELEWSKENDVWVPVDRKKNRN